MNRIQTVICGLLGFFISWTLVRLILRRVIWFGGWGVQRQFHQTHTTPVPRMGGLALAAAFAAVSAVVLIFHRPDTYQDHTQVAIVLCALAMFGVGFADDLRPLSAKLKLLAQVLIALAAVSQGVSIESFKNPFTGVTHHLDLLVYPVGIFWIVAVTNLINLVDGLDGLAGGIGFMVMCLLAYVGMRGEVSFTVLISMGMTGALLGFLYYNFPPAKIYMGDGGAYLLGFLISALSIQGSQKGLTTMALLAPVFALAVPIVDVAMAIMRRGVRGLPIFRPDRKHIHHRLAQLGLSPLKAVLILYGLSLLFLSMGYMAFWTEGKMLPLLIAAGALVIIVGIRSLGLIHELTSVRHLMGDTGKLRRNVRYALVLGEWFDLAAERSGSTAEFRDDFIFCLRKLGFSRVVVRQGETERIWQGVASGAGGLIDRHEFNVEDETFSLEFHAPNIVIESKTFFLLTELMAEAWLRAGRRWNQTHTKPLALAEVKPAAN